MKVGRVSQALPYLSARGGSRLYSFLLDKPVDGVRQTIDWYFASKDRFAVGADLERKLTER